MIYAVLITWFFGSFLYSKSLDGTWNEKQENISIMPPIFFIFWVATCSVSIFKAINDVNWTDPAMFNSFETIPWAVLFYTAFAMLDLMSSRVTFFILKHVASKVEKEMKAAFENVYYIERPVLFRYRKLAEIKKKKESF
jgi:hypothetical protein